LEKISWLVACIAPKAAGLLTCFANENHKLGNEPKLMQHLREVWLKTPRRDPLSAEMNDASV